MFKSRLSHISCFAVFSAGCFIAFNANAAPRDAFGLDAESASRAMAITASASPVAAPASNPARLMDAKNIEASVGIMVADDKLSVNHQDAGLDTYVGYQFGIAARIPLGSARDRLFIGADIHLPNQGLYEVRNAAAETPVILESGSDNRHFTLEAALAVRIWERISIGIGFYLMPTVSADVNINLVNGTDKSSSLVNVDYKMAPTVGIYAEPVEGLHLGFAYHAATRLDLSVPANVSVSNAINDIHVQLTGHAYAEPHTFSLGVRYDFSHLTDIALAHFAADLDFQYRYFPDDISASANVTLFDDEGGILDMSNGEYAAPEHAWMISSAVTWMPLDEVSVSVGYAFKKSHVPAQRSIFNVLDSDSSLLSFGTTLWLPDEYLGAFGIGFSTSAMIDFHVPREMEKYEYLAGNPGFPKIRFDGFHYSWHAAILLRFE